MQVGLAVYYVRVHNVHTAYSTWLATVKRTLVDIGLDVHTQNFTAFLPHLQYPVDGTNLYASLKAQRASGIEALVIHVPLENVNAVSFAIAFAKFCKGTMLSL